MASLIARRQAPTFLRSSRPLLVRNVKFGQTVGHPHGLTSARLRLGTSAFSVLAAPGFDSASSLFFQSPQISAEEEDAPRAPATILASSAVVDDDDNLLQAMVRWLKDFIRRCYKAAVLTIHGTEVALRLSPLTLLTPASMVGARLFEPNRISDWTWAYFISAMQALGPSYVKLCQWVATRRDIFPPHVCDRLARLHDRGYPHPWTYTDSILIEAFGDYEAKGLTVDREVVGCGSAAQVHRGTLTTTNDRGEEVVSPVAVKILHPRFQKRIGRDVMFMQAVANLLNALPSEQLKMLNLPRVAENFGDLLYRQSDLRIEGENLKQFRSNFYRDANEAEASAIHFPRPVEGWASENVLVEDLIENAIPVAEYLKDGTDQGTEVRKELASPLLRAFLKMVFIDNFTHSDLHPGNVMIQTSLVRRKTPSGWGFASKTSAESRVEVKRTIVFLDAGIATSLQPQDQRNLRDLFKAVILNEGDKAGRLMVERAKYERCSETEGGVDAFARGIEELVSEFHDRRKEGLTLGAVRIGSLLSRVLDLCRVHGVEVDPAMASIVISTLVLEGLGRSLEPELNLIDFAVPFVLGRGRV